MANMLRILVLLSLGLGLGFGCLGCSHLFYYPTRVKYVDDRKLSRPPKEVSFVSEDGTKLVGWHFKSGSEKPKAVLIFFHGNGQNVSSHFVSLYWILEHQYDFFIFDYPGYGGSEGESTPKGTVLAGKAAVRWAHAEYPKTPLVIFGQSLGGAVAQRTVIELRKEIPLCLMVLDSTFVSYQSVGRDVLAGNVWTWIFQPLAYLLLSDKWSAEGRLEEIAPIPSLVIHGDADAIVRFKRGKEVYSLLPEPKEFWPVPGGDHISAFTGNLKKELRPKFLRFLAQKCSVTK